MTTFKTLDDIGDVAGKRVLVRVDLNVPMSDGAVTDDTRIRAAMPTIRELSDKGAIVLLLAHFGRPKGAKNPTQSLSLVIDAVADVLGHSVMFIPDCIGEGAKAGLTVLASGDVAVMENTRFHPGEEKNDPAFADALAEIGDLYVNDAFSAAHRAHGS
ncbi:MAG TPA: phosphoglycerate kinase, partial [Sphingopyxis sp.]|nr:phosphoglycerate kinase [Sphingopyxis sp.]